MKKRPVTVFLITFVAISIITLLFPIKMYDGEALRLNGDTEPIKLSLSFLIDKADYIFKHPHLKDIYLNRTGWLLVLAINFGLPGLLALRTAVADKNRKKRKKQHKKEKKERKAKEQQENNEQIS